MGSETPINDPIKAYWDLIAEFDKASALSIIKQASEEGYDAAYHSYLAALGKSALPHKPENFDLVDLLSNALISRDGQFPPRDLIKRLKKAQKIEGISTREWVRLAHSATTPVDVLTAAGLVKSWLENSHENPPNWLMHALVQIGFLLGKRQSLADSLSSKLNSISAGKGGASTAKLTQAEWGLVADYIRDRCKEKVSATDACKEAGAQLRTGKFPDIDRMIDVEDETLRKRWSKRSGKR